MEVESVDTNALKTLFGYYRIKPMASGGGFKLGYVLNADGSIYNGDMTKESTPTSPSITSHPPLYAVDGQIVRVSGDKFSQHVDIHFTQTTNGQTKGISSVRIGSYEEALCLVKELVEKLDEFRGKTIPAYELEATSQQKHALILSGDRHGYEEIYPPKESN
jgi:hypothetical protein